MYNTKTNKAKLVIEQLGTLQRSEGRNNVKKEALKRYYDLRNKDINKTGNNHRIRGLNCSKLGNDL